MLSKDQFRRDVQDLARSMHAHGKSASAIVQLVEAATEFVNDPSEQTMLDLMVIVNPLTERLAPDLGARIAEFAGQCVVPNHPTEPIGWIQVPAGNGEQVDRPVYGVEIISIEAHKSEAGTWSLAVAYRLLGRRGDTLAIRRSARYVARGEAANEMEELADVARNEIIISELGARLGNRQ